MRLPISEVITVFTTRAVVNKQKQKFVMLDFDVIPPKAGPEKAKPLEQDDVEDVPVDDDVPF